MTRQQIEKHFATLEAYATKDAQNKKEEEGILAMLRIAQCVVKDLNRIADALDVNIRVKS